MEITSIAPCFLISACLIFGSNIIVRQVKFYQRLIETSPLDRYTSLDGLRGFLALGVFFCHSTMMYNYFQTGTWTNPPSIFYPFLGGAAVACFFMITGFLFWSKILTGKLNIRSFYIGRIFRIYPLYWVSLLLILIGVFVASNFSLKVAWTRLIYEITRWLSCGLLNFPFITGNVASPPINTINTIPINAGVQWTLIYEVQLYLILPLLAIFAKPARFFLLSAILLALSYYFPNQPIMVMINFLFGMGAAYIVNHLRLENMISHHFFSVSMIALLILSPFISTHRIVFYTAIFLVLLIVIYGNNFFGLLTLPASRYLGTVSYSIYLLHGIVLFYVFSIVNKIYPIQGMEPIYFWLLVGFCGLILIVVSGATYRLVEYPFLMKKRPASLSAK